jgi:hypothetical protein
VQKESPQVPNFGLLDLVAAVSQLTRKLAYHLPHSDEPWIMRSPPGTAAASSSGSGGAAPPPPPPPTQPTRTPFGDDPPEGDDDDDNNDEDPEEEEEEEEEDPEDPDDSEGTDEEEEPEEWEWRCSLTRAELNVIMERKVSAKEWEIAKNYLATRLDYIVANNIKDELERHFDNLRGDDEPAAAPASSAAAAPAAAPTEVWRYRCSYTKDEAEELMARPLTPQEWEKVKVALDEKFNDWWKDRDDVWEYFMGFLEDDFAAEEDTVRGSDNDGGSAPPPPPQEEPSSSAAAA